MDKDTEREVDLFVKQFKSWREGIDALQEATLVLRLNFFTKTVVTVKSRYGGLEVIEGDGPLFRLLWHQAEVRSKDLPEVRWFVQESPRRFQE